jgi:hypothetical protein
MHSFTVADLDASGGLLMHEVYTYATLERVPGAIDIIAQTAGALYRSPEEFDVRLDGSHLGLRWLATGDSSGIVTIRLNKDLASLSLVVCGVSTEQDSLTLEAFQRHLVSELHDTGYEPGFALVQIVERPLLATINFRSPADGLERMRLALADRCFGAAYFRTRGLA